MSVPNRTMVAPGEGATYVDVQRIADAAGSADDRALEVLATPGAVMKTVTPLLEETASVKPKTLVVPSGGTSGACDVPACAFTAAVADGVGRTIDLSVTSKALLTSPVFAANHSGQQRTDLLYATINRGIPAGSPRARRIKTASGSTPNTQTINTYDTPQVTLGIAAGTPGGAAGSLPADNVGGLAFNLPLAYVGIQDNYNLNQAIQASWIQQQWVRGGVPAARLRSLVPSMLAAGGDPNSPTAVAPRTGPMLWAHCGSVHLPSDPVPGGLAVLLDNSIDWRNRVLNVWACRSVAEAGGHKYVGPDRNTNTGASTSVSTGAFMTGGSGSGSMSVTAVAAGNAGHDITLTFSVTNTGVLKVTISTQNGGGPLDQTFGDTWWYLIAYTDTFLGNAE